MKIFNLLLFISIFFICLGCEPTRVRESTGFERTETEFVVTIVVDLSGSFLDKMAEGGAAYRFILSVIDKLARDRPGQEGRLIVGQISLNPKSTLFEGALADFRKQFSSPKEFADYLRANSDPSGSAVYYSMANSMEYLLSSTAVRENNATPMLLVLSDMADNTTIRDEELARVEEMLTKLAEANGIAAIYFADQRLISDWQQLLAKSGLQSWRVEADVVSNPEPPNFAD